MFSKPSLITRIVIGKTIGLIIGLIGFFTLPHIYPEASHMLRWGILLWYITFGAIIGIFGVFTYHPILKSPMPWWFRAPFIGAWLNFVLVFFAHKEMTALLTVMFGENGLMQSPFWFVLEGALVGLLIGFLATKFAGEGKEAVGR
ncbi:MAG: hypothetical protein HWD86_04200 [Kangiellaceae bacterium]|nr:hypothetical protein [Kangiellaceae bacterium]